MEHGFKRQLRCLLFLTSISKMYIYNPILVVFLASSVSLNYFQIGVVTACFYIINIFVQFPCGMLVDKQGPKKLIVAGFLLQAAGILLLVRSASMAGAIAGVSILSSGTTSIVTADRVYFYALHNKYQKTDSYHKNFSSYFSCRLIGGTIASVLCSLLFMQKMEYAFYLTVLLNLVAVAVSLCLENLLPAGGSASAKSFSALLRYGYSEITANNRLKALIKYCLAMVTVYLILYMQIQQYLIFVGFDIGYSGIFYAILGVLSPALAKLTSSVKLQTIYWIIPVLTIGSLACMAVVKHPAAVVFLVLFWGLYGIISPKVDSEIDASIKNAEASRGSILSYLLMFQNMIIAVMLIVNGYIIEKANMGILLLGYSAVYLLLSIACIKLLHKLFKQAQGR